MKKKIGVLLVNLGTPNHYNVSDVRKYLYEFLMDGRVIDIPYLYRWLLINAIIVPFRAINSAKLYKKIWTDKGSPLKVYGEEVLTSLRKKMGEDYVIELAMRYQNPSIESALLKLQKSFVDEIVIFPMFPQYASASTGSVFQKVMDIVGSWQTVPKMSFIHSYPDHKDMIEVFVEKAEQHLNKGYDHILFSFHGIPQRHLRKGDCSKKYCMQVKNCCSKMSSANRYCYSAQCYQTAFKIAEKLNLKREDYTICFQSRLGRDPWTQPYTSAVIKELSAKGVKKIVAFCPAFVADCLETTYEMAEEYADEFKEAGGESLLMVESLNDHPKWINAIENLIKNR